MSNLRVSRRLPARRLARATAAAVAVFAGSLAVAATAPPGLDDMVAAERAFARTSVERGMKPAFVEFLAHDAVLFRPGPVNGLRLWQSRPASEAVLDWAPSFAEVAGSGDFGFTSGPWTLTPAGKKSPAAFGHFVTAWKRDGEGRWRAALDIGISHRDPGTALDRVTLVRGPLHPRPDSTQWRRWDAGVGVQRGHVGVGVGTGGVGVGIFSGHGVGVGLGTGGIRSRRDYEWRRTAHEKNELMSQERRLAFEARSHGWDRAYRAVAANDLRVYREDHEPDLGIDAAVEASRGVPGSREFVSRGNGVAPSWDLGYAYGLAIARPKGGPPDTASYVHLYRKDDAGAWRMMLDIENPFPKRSR